MKGISRVVRTRYAPSPTGLVHLGGLRTALYNYLLAKKHHGQFLLRIEDTDKTREVPGSAKLIESDLKWANIHHDEGPGTTNAVGPYIQSHRLHHYHHHAEQLLKHNHAYRCFCTPERLAAVKDRTAQKGVPTLYDRHCLSLTQQEIQENLHKKIPYTIRMKIPPGVTDFNDVIRGHVSFQNSGIDDQILLKSDGFPTYHLACIVDDHLMQISHVIRGEEWLSSTPKHVMLYKMFGWDMPEFAHLPLLVNEDKSKLSKRQGDASVSYYKDAGYLPEALVNFVALLGWTPSSTQEVFTMKQLIDEFSLDRVHKGAAVVAVKKLNWFNEQHTRSKVENDIGSLVSALKPLVQLHVQEYLKSSQAQSNPVDSRSTSEDYLAAVIRCIEKRILFTKDIPSKHFYFFADPVLSRDDPLCKKMWNEKSIGYIPLMEQFVDTVNKNPTFSAQSITSAMEEVAKASGVSLAELFTPIRYLVTGTNIGAGVPPTMETLGKEISVHRIQKGLNLMKSQ